MVSPPNKRTEDVDERLLTFLPLYVKLWCKDNPHLGRANEATVREGLLLALQAQGYAERTVALDGRVSWRPTPAYLAELERCRRAQGPNKIRKSETKSAPRRA